MGSLPSGQDYKSVTTNSRARPIAIVIQAISRDLNHSPLESPPTIKKKLCRFVDGVASANMRSLDGALEALLMQGRPSQPPSVQRAIPKEVLNNTDKTTYSRTLRHVVRDRVIPAIRLKSILKQNGHTMKSQSKLPTRVQFNPNVTVCLVSEDGVVCMDCKSLNAENGDRSAFRLQKRLSKQASSSQRTVLNAIQLPVSASRASSVPLDDDTYDNLTATFSLSASPQNMIYEDVSGVNFSFVEDRVNGVVLKFSIALGTNYHPDDIVVKANVSGSKVRVVASRTAITSDGGSVLKEFNRRYTLPMDVDPYLVTARLDVKGNLTVEAPLMTLARKETLKVKADKENRRKLQAIVA